MRHAKKSKTFKYRSAKNQQGFILRNFFDGSYFFRIYGKHGSFKDYDIAHHDLEVQIVDGSAEFLESSDGKKLFLDYSRRALGQGRDGRILKTKLKVS